MPRLLITAERREGNEYFKLTSLRLGRSTGRAHIVSYFELVGGLLGQNDRELGADGRKSWPAD